MANPTPEQVKNWRIANIDRVKQYAKEYQSRPEVRQRTRDRQNAKYHAELKYNDEYKRKAAESQKKIRERDVEAARAKDRDKSNRYKLKNRAEINARQNSAYQSMTEEDRKAIYQKRAAYLREYRHKNKVELAKKSAAKRRSDFASDPEFYKRLYRKNRERYIQQANKRQRRVKDRGMFTAEDIDALFEKQSAMCAYCECDISKAFEIDHVMPISLGGMNTADNLVLACRPCNRKKHNKHPDDWAEELKKRKCAA